MIDARREHSFFDKNCTCNILHDSFVEQSNCVANEGFESTESFMGVSFGTYLGLGGEISVDIDLEALHYDLIDIFTEPYVGYY